MSCNGLPCKPGSGTDSTTGTDSGGQGEATGGCGCRQTPSPAAGSLAALLLTCLGLRRRRCAA